MGLKVANGAHGAPQFFGQRRRGNDRIALCEDLWIAVFFPEDLPHEIVGKQDAVVEIPGVDKALSLLRDHADDDGHFAVIELDRFADGPSGRTEEAFRDPIAHDDIGCSAVEIGLLKMTSGTDADLFDLVKVFGISVVLDAGEGIVAVIDIAGIVDREVDVLRRPALLTAAAWLLRISVPGVSRISTRENQGRRSIAICRCRSSLCRTI